MKIHLKILKTSQYLKYLGEFKPHNSKGLHAEHQQQKVKGGSRFT